MTRKITRKDIGAWVRFQGFDGKEYAGMVADVKRRVATIEYPLYPGGRLYRAYLEPKDHDRAILIWR